MVQQVPIDPASLTSLADSSPSEEAVHSVCADIAYRRIAFVNIVFVGLANAGDRGWVLIDAGLPGTHDLIKRAAASRFGAKARPSAIVMTHGHFDHVGALEDLAEDWDAPVFAHLLEHPYLNGCASYPSGDPAVGGGMMTLLSPLFPTRPVNVGDRLKPLLDDGSILPMPGWRWIHSPGHSPGHVSFWREADCALVAGDAFVTVASESVYATAIQEPEVHGPPKYFTVDWSAAKASVELLAGLKPQIALTGHGRPLAGPALQDGLAELALRFDDLAVPQRGRYIDAPAQTTDGSAYRDTGHVKQKL